MSDAAKQEVGRLLAALPPTVTVDGMVIELMTTDEIKEGDAWGMFRGYTQQIKIAKDIPTPERLAVVVFHELCHAAYYFRDIVDNGKVRVDTEERLVDTTSVAIMAMFAYNPWLMPWLYECQTWRNKTDDDVWRQDKLLHGLSPLKIRGNGPAKPLDTRDRAGALGKAQGGAEDRSGPEILGTGETAASPKR